MGLGPLATGVVAPDVRPCRGVDDARDPARGVVPGVVRGDDPLPRLGVRPFDRATDMLPGVPRPLLGDADAAVGVLDRLLFMVTPANTRDGGRVGFVRPSRDAPAPTTHELCTRPTATQPSAHKLTWSDPGALHTLPSHVSGVPLCPRAFGSRRCKLPAGERARLRALGAAVLATHNQSQPLVPTAGGVRAAVWPAAVLHTHNLRTAWHPLLAPKPWNNSNSAQQDSHGAVRKGFNSPHACALLSRPAHNTRLLSVRVCGMAMYVVCCE